MPCTVGHEGIVVVVVVVVVAVVVFVVEVFLLGTLHTCLCSASGACWCGHFNAYTFAESSSRLSNAPKCSEKYKQFVLGSRTSYIIFRIDACEYYRNNRGLLSLSLPTLGGLLWLMLSHCTPLLSIRRSYVCPAQQWQRHPPVALRGYD